MIAASTTEPPVGASTCASGSQVCTGHIGTFTANARKNARNTSICAPMRERQPVVVEEREAAAARRVEVDQRDQREQRPGERVEEELDRRVDAVRPAPDADDDEHRDQGRLEEHVEQQRVERAEHAVHEAREEQERGHVLRHALLDHLPARDHHQHGGEAVEQDEQQRDAVDAEVVVDVEGLDPRLRARRTGSRSPSDRSRV